MSLPREKPLPELRRVFAGLVAEHEPGLQRFCRSFLHDETLAADASQETLLRLWRNLLLDDAPQHPGAWLRRVAARCASDLMRGKRRQEAAIRKVPEFVHGGDATSGLAAAETQELRDCYGAALAELPEQQRITFLLRHEAGMRLADVAEALDLSLPTVKTHFARACLKLQSRLRAFREDKSS